MKKKKKKHSLNMFPVKMIRYFFFFVERVGGGGREREEGREGEARMAQGRERSLFPTPSL